MKKILVLGANGQLGQDFVRTCPSGYAILPFTRKDLDLENLDALHATLAPLEIQGIINTAAYHRSSECEAHPDKAFLLNCLLPRELAKIAREKESFLVHISTNFVFDGQKKKPYIEEDPPRPISTYGITRYMGELFIQSILQNHYIFRVACLFGKGGNKPGRENFVYKILKTAREGKEIKIIQDAITCPTFTMDLCSAAWEIIQNQRDYGVYHIANQGMASWYEFGLAIAKAGNLPLKAIPIKQDEFFGKEAQRPLFTPLASSKNIHLRPWQEALQEFVSSLIAEQESTQ
ncbi:MAG: dTDP-4-dehydrorhamnose reductase [Planctomycetota bacterium]|nr:MAG: dTDP-4-dehydrorhamnose reductase [Planctomycetota bacterium]